MNTVVVVLVIVNVLLVLLGLAILLVYLKGKKQYDSVPSDQATSMQMLMQQINALTDKFDSKLSENTQNIHQTLSSQTQTHLSAIRDVTERLVRLDNTNRQVVGFAEELKSLQDILKNPKQRGILGEYYLETSLQNVLSPKNYKMQYPFPDGSIVDAVIFVGDTIIPVDSKFSLENYNRIVEATDKSERERLEKDFKADIKKRIDETSKYIRPQDKTTEFAFMFIPHEAIYYDLLVNEVGAMKINTRDLIEYALSKKVVIVSPTSFYAFLQTVLHGLRMMSIEESAHLIQKRVEDLSRHLKVYEEYHNKVGKSLSTTVNHYNIAHKELNKIDKDVHRIGDGESLSLEDGDITLSVTNDLE